VAPLVCYPPWGWWRSWGCFGPFCFSGINTGWEAPALELSELMLPTETLTYVSGSSLSLFSSWVESFVSFSFPCLSQPCLRSQIKPASSRKIPWSRRETFTFCLLDSVSPSVLTLSTDLSPPGDCALPSMANTHSKSLWRARWMGHTVMTAFSSCPLPVTDDQLKNL
jgi:hypothetical protein